MSKLGKVDKMDEIRTSRLVIEDEDGKTVATLQAAEKGAGLWLNSPDGQTVAIFAVEGQTAIGLYAKKGDEQKGCDLALSVSGGKPTVQFRVDGGDAVMVGLDELARCAREKCCE